MDMSHDAELTAQASALAHTWLQDRSSLTPVNRALVLRAAAFQGDRAYFDALAAAAIGNPDRRERADIYGALSSFRAPELAQAARELWLSPQHDIRELMVASRVRGQTEIVREGALRFLQTHFDALAAKVSKEAVTRFPQMFEGACTAADADQLEQFFTPLAVSYTGLSKNLAQALETVRLCAHFRDAQHASLQEFLSRY